MQILKHEGLTQRNYFRILPRRPRIALRNVKILAHNIVEANIYQRKTTAYDYDSTKCNMAIISCNLCAMP